MNITQILSDHFMPIFAIIGYFLYPKSLRINPYILYISSIAHNGCLVIFSFWTFISLFQVLYNDGLVFQTNYYFKNPLFDKIIYLFYISKYYEFFDTFLLYLNGKNPIFLQKFHHIGAVICWHFSYVYKVDCIWMPTILNSFVHTIMYSYYLGCLLKIKQVKFIKKYITSLQLIQLSIPNFFGMYLYYPPVETEFNYNIIKLFLVYIYILIGLFIQFYYNNYVKGK